MASNVPSRPPSVPPSFRSQSATPVNAPAKAAAHAALPQPNSSTFRQKLKGMFDQQRSTTFEVNVTLHELGNIPQLGGQFAVKWKFRGRRPPDADRLLEHPVQRIVAASETKLHGKSQSKTLRHSASAMSLRTTSTTSTSTGTSTPSPTWTTNINRVLTPHALSPHTLPHHTSSLPTLPAQSSQTLEGKYPDRKTTDPTPLRQSTKPSDDEEDSCRLIIEEPDQLPAGGSAHSDGSDEAQNSQDTTSSTVPTLATEIETSTTRSVPSITSSKFYPASVGAGSSTPSLASTLPPVVQDAKGSRVPSRASMHSDHSTNPSVVVSRPGQGPPLAVDSTERKGRTPTRSIRSHAVTWEYKIQHVIRIPLGKPVEVEGSRHRGKATPKRSLPMLGGGPLSVSSLKLDIEEVDQRGEAVKTPSGRDVLFGFVNIDLAPFADQGPVTRKFLLKNSKTNATIRITVDMRYIGGEQEWASPPMEGHVVQGISELAGEEHYPDLQLLPSTSISSNSDRSYQSSLSARPPSRSAVSLTKLPTSISAAAQSTKHRYRTYDHHLLPEIASKKHSMHHRSSSHTPHHGHRSASSPPGPWSPTMEHTISSWPSSRHSDSQSGSPGRRSPTNSPRLFPNGGVITASPQSTPALLPNTGSPTTSPGLLPVPLSPPRQNSFAAFGTNLSPITTRSDASTTLSAVESRGSIFSRLSPITTRLDASDASAPNTAIPAADFTSPLVRPHHSHFLRDRDDDSHDLSPDVVIESIFNPTASEEYTPFTYLAKLHDEADADNEGEEADADDDFDDGGFGGEKVGRSGRLGIGTPGGSHPTTWRKLRRRVLSHPHKCGQREQ